MRNVWLRIGLGACGIFLVGMIAVKIFRVGRDKVVSTFDTALAPVIATLDGLPGYVDPWLAPTDFLDWLAGWVGVEVDEEWTVPQRRQIVAGAALRHRRRGTAAGRPPDRRAEPREGV
jgi:hypothetical protein